MYKEDSVKYRKIVSYDPNEYVSLPANIAIIQYAEYLMYCVNAEYDLRDEDSVKSFGVWLKSEI